MLVGPEVCQCCRSQFPDDRVSIDTAGRDSFSVFAEVDERIRLQNKRAAIRHFQRRQFTLWCSFPDFDGVVVGKRDELAVAAEPDLGTPCSLVEFAILLCSQVPEFETLVVDSRREQVSFGIE